MVKKSGTLIATFGFLSLVIWLLMITVYPVESPKNCPGGECLRSYHTAIGLAADFSEISKLLGSPEAGSRLIKNLKGQIVFDYFFPIAYTLLNISIFLLIHLYNQFLNRAFYSRKFFLNAGTLISAAAGIADILENIEMFRLLSMYPESYHGPLLYFSSIKWLLLGGAALLQGMGYASLFGQSVWQILPFFYTTASVFYFIGVFVSDARFLVEWGVMFHGCAWCFTIVHVFFDVKRVRKKRTA